jgi:hypothetical protein
MNSCDILYGFYCMEMRICCGDLNLATCWYCDCRRASIGDGCESFGHLRVVGKFIVEDMIHWLTVIWKTCSLVGIRSNWHFCWIDGSSSRKYAPMHVVLRAVLRTFLLLHTYVEPYCLDKLILDWLHNLNWCSCSIVTQIFVNIWHHQIILTRSLVWRKIWWIEKI